MNYKLTKAIEEAIDNCKASGSATVRLTDTHNTRIEADWEDYVLETGYDVIGIYIYKNNILVFDYQVEETLISQEEDWTMNEYEYGTLSEIVNGEYLESDIPELIITENSHIERITKAFLIIILEHIEPHLKKSFESKKNEIIKEILESAEDDYDITEKIRYVVDDVLVHMRDSYGELRIDNNSSSGNIHRMWELPRESGIKIKARF